MADLLPVVWKIVGGADKGGIIARVGQDLSSPQSPTRLSTNALVRELERHGDRIKFQRLTGEGPDTGWISISLKDKILACQVPSEIAVSLAKCDADSDADDEPPFPAMSSTAHSEPTEADEERRNLLKQEAVAAIEDGQIELALEKFTEAISLGNAPALLYCRRAEILLQLIRPRATVNDCTAALAINPDSGKAFKIRARAHAKLKKWAEAHADFQTGLKIDYDETTYEESLVAAERAKELQAVDTAVRVQKEVADERQKKQTESKERAHAQAPSPSQPKPEQPKFPVSKFGDGIKKCLVCGWKAAGEKSKQVHSAIEGHAGFYDSRGKLLQYQVIGRGGG